MKKRSKNVETDGHLQLCVLNKVKIEVVFFGQIDHVGVLKRFDDLVIEFDDSYYILENVTLKIAK